MNFEFPRTHGQEDAKQRLRLALSSGRFPHALLVHGEPGLGQHALLLDLAQILSCEDGARRPCGTCFPCRAFDASGLETLNYLIPVVKADPNGEGDGSDPVNVEEQADAIAEWHTHPHRFRVADKASVRMAQVRSLIGRLRFSEEKGRARIVLIPWLEALDDPPANALLKTLEEPPSDVYFLIGSDHFRGLLPTLLSRSLHVGLSPLRIDEMRTTVETLSRLHDKTVSTRLLPFAEGSPGVYLDLLEAGGDALLEDALRFLSAASADWRVFADYAAEIAPGAEGLEQTVRLLHVLMRMLRAHQYLRGRHPGTTGGADAGYRWTAEALEREGWDSSLAAYLGAFEDVADVHAFAAFLDAALAAVRGYSKPSIALVGLFLEYEAKAAQALKIQTAAMAGVAT